MSCKTFNLKSCEIRGATYQGRKIDFVNKVITQDTFTAKVYDTQGYLLTEIIGLKSGSVVYFPFTAIQNLSKDKYRIKYWADFYLLGTIPLGEEELTIGNTCPNCEVDDSTLPFVLELGTETIDFTLQLVYIAIGNGGGEVDLSEYLKKVDADQLYALKNHTHSYNDLTDLPPNQNIDSVVTIGAVTATTNNVNLALHFSGINRVYIGGENYYKVTEDNFSFTPVTTGIKVLLIYALPNSQIFYLAEGIESSQTVEPTGLPINALLVARLIVSSTGIVITIEDYNYKQKSDDAIETVILNDDNPYWSFGARTNYDVIATGSITNPTLAGFKYIDSSGDIWTGKKSLIRNRTGLPLLLKKTTAPIDSLIYFTFKNDVTIPNGKDVFIVYDNDNEVAVVEIGGGGATLPPAPSNDLILESDDTTPEGYKWGEKLKGVADKIVHSWNATTSKWVSTGVEFVSSGILKLKSIQLTNSTGIFLPNELGTDGTNVLFGVAKKKVAFQGEIFEHNVRGKRVEATVSGTYNIDLSAGSHFSLTMSANTSFDFSNMILSDETCTITITLKGSFVPTFPAWLKADSYNDEYVGVNNNEYTITIKKGGISPSGRINMITVPI